MIGKAKIESMCRAAGVIPVAREKVAGTEVFIADGFSADPHVAFQKFDIKQGDFPFGCFGTFWWTFESEDKFSLGRPLFFDAFHNPELSKSSKQQARIRAAVKDARFCISERKKAAH